MVQNVLFLVLIAVNFWKIKVSNKTLIKDYLEYPVGQGGCFDEMQKSKSNHNQIK